MNVAINPTAALLVNFGLAAAQFALERQRLIAEEVARRVPADATPDEVKKILQDISREALDALEAEIAARLAAPAKT